MEKKESLWSIKKKPRKIWRWNFNWMQSVSARGKQSESQSSLSEDGNNSIKSSRERDGNFSSILFFLPSHRCQKVYISFDIDDGTMLFHSMSGAAKMRFSCHCHSFNIIHTSMVCRTRLALFGNEKMTLHFGWHKTTVLFTYGWMGVLKKYLQTVHQNWDWFHLHFDFHRARDCWEGNTSSYFFISIERKWGKYSNPRNAKWIWLLCWCIQCMRRGWICDQHQINQSIISEEKDKNIWYASNVKTGKGGKCAWRRLRPYHKLKWLCNFEFQ